MTVMSWIREKLNCKPADDKFIEAIAATEGLAIAARSLREQLEPFKLADDPFAAMMHAKRISRAYEEKQESLIYRGPLR